MEAIKVQKDLYWVGARDQGLRVFDVIMRTDYGTTYNSYLIKGEKNILIDTVKIGFFNEYRSALEKVLGDEDIDYIICNHTEPDHSGSIKNILSKYPNAQVICSKPAGIYLKAMLNEEFNCRTVSDSEELTLGSRKFRFIMAPFLHWPDTMFTYLVDEKVLFTGDFLGCHFCPPEGKLYNDEVGDFSEAFRYYFDVIMGPFKEHVLKAVEKLKGLAVELVGPSHGPLLRKKIPEYVELYRKWSQDALYKSDKKYVLIGYVSAYHFTRSIAEKLYETLAADNLLDVELIDLSEYSLMDVKKKIENADGILLGSPTFNQDALKPVWDVLSVICPINVRGKLAAAFGSYGWSGEAVKLIEDRLKGLKFKVVESGLRFNFTPSDDDLDKTGEFGKSFREMLLK